MKSSFLQTIPIFDAGDKGDDGNSPPVCKILGAFPRNRDNEILMTVRKIKIRNRNRKRSKKKNDSTELTEAANDTPIPMFNSFEPKHRLQTQN